MSDPSLLAGRYRLLERRDHTGASWRARDEALHRDVTISEVRLPPPGPHRDWLMGQIRAAADLRHPGVVALHDVITAPDRVWLVLEAAEGRSLMQTVRAEGPLPTARAAEVGLKVLDALTAAQERGLRLTATPDSILLAPDGRVVLTGVAAPAPADDLRTLGAALFTAVEGRLPGTGSSVRTADGTPLASPETGSTGSGPLAPLLDGLLAENPAHRPDATSVRLALEGLSPRPAPSRRRPLLVGASAAAVAVVLLTGVLVWLRPGSTGSTGPTAAPVTLPASFAELPDPCSLISEEQRTELQLASTPSEHSKKKCKWLWTSGVPQNLVYTLELDAFRLSSEKVAKENYIRFREQTAERTTSGQGLPLTVVRPPEAVPGIGDEAFTGEVTNGLTYLTTVTFRARNAVIVVQYSRNGSEDPGGTTRDGGLKIARWILDVLSRQG
ncbi:hypothetical protein [Planomonospora venezuelensis]|uniref:Protein kinase domain-containing protein n=1 Tax=Planomonospora venezuelensis TaxID=1999 RepID=A0A841D395_PLAVE|nr:hypothetical protein [Planomonospora venezuelensis]MBB5961966.1 hypothetical protein [Planomonospora venezuelensis]GIM98990.1 hypothetical protein Pve01_06490 [Planomonospora venezuelensis]